MVLVLVMVLVIMMMTPMMLMMLMLMLMMMVKASGGAVVEDGCGSTSSAPVNWNAKWFMPKPQSKMKANDHSECCYYYRHYPYYHYWHR